MARTFVQQHTQIRRSNLYSDAIATGTTMETATVSLQDDLNSLRSITKLISGETKWYTALSGRDLATLSTDLGTVETKRFLFRTQILTDITVTAAQNWEVLSVAGSEAPTQTAAVGAVTTVGAVVAAHGGAFGTAHALSEVAGPSTIRPNNLLVIRDASTGQPLQSGGKDVWGLLQSESATDGHTFNDTTQQVQISFVIENGTGDDLIACPVIDIAGKTVNYSYVRRLDWASLPESAWLAGVFVDQSASVDVTLDNAIDNQGVTPATQAQNITVDMTSGTVWEYGDALSARLWAVIEGSGGSTSEVHIGPDVDLYDNDAADVDFLQGIKADSGGTQLNLGVTAGQVDSAGALTVASGGAADLTLSAALEILFTDSNKGGSTFAGPLKLAETSAEWSAYETAFGEVSLLNAIEQAANAAASRNPKVYANVTLDTNPDIDVGGVGGGTNLDAQLPDMSGGTFLTDFDVFVNGELLRPGANAAANNDYYPGTSLINGQLKFEFAVEANEDVICVIPYA